MQQISMKTTANVKQINSVNPYQPRQSGLAQPNLLHPEYVGTYSPAVQYLTLQHQGASTSLTSSPTEKTERIEHFTYSGTLHFLLLSVLV